VQKQKLHDEAQQETKGRQNGDEEVLPLLQGSHFAQGSKGLIEIRY
jgi:hypothetical protein